MRRLLFLFLLTASVSGVYAQKLDDVQKDISNNKYSDAKVKIDKILTDPKQAADAKVWFYKGKVYAALAAQDTANTLGFDANMEAFQAFKKYQEMDPKNTFMLLDQNVGLFQVFDIYYNQGVKSYNTKDYTAAYQKMKTALEVQKYIRDKGYSYNGFSFPVLDTTLVNLTASSAYLAKKESESIPYFEKLADAKIKDKEYREIYALLVEYYTNNKNTEKADKYLNIGRELFPDAEYWVNVEFGAPGNDKQKRIARYEEMVKKYPANYTLAMDYAIELFNYAYSYDTKPADYTERQERAQKALENAISVQSTSTANFVMSQHIYNQIYDLEETARLMKGTTAADLAKKKALNENINKKYEDLYTYSLKAYELFGEHEKDLKAQDKANYRKVINQLIDYHQRKKQADKVALYQAKIKTL
jgi:hypothetical protein